MSAATYPIQAANPSPDAVREQMARILDLSFRGSSQMSRFLVFTVEQSLSGNAENLKEMVLGVDVCGRGQRFDPRIDPIVRVTANRLRAKLDSYYSGPGREDSIRIDYNPGSYSPVFYYRSEEQSGPAAGAVCEPPAASVGRASARRSPMWLALGVTVAAVFVLTSLRGAHAPVPRQIPPIRFAAQPPAGRPMETLGFGGLAAISPDGAHIVYTTRAVSESYGDLRLTTLTNQTTRTLAGVRGARHPFWSPDSKQIGFFADRKLKRIDPGTGVVETVCEYAVVHPQGGSWSPRGVILYSPGPGNGIYRASVAGGECQQITAPGPSDTHGHAWPSFLPDGEHFLYTVFQRDRERSGVYVASLRDPGAAKLVLRARSAAAYTPIGDGNRGALLYVESGTLMAVAFDPKTLNTSGEPWTAEQKTGYYDFNGGADFSVSQNGILAFRSGQAVPERELVWVDRGGKRAPSPIGRGLIRYPNVAQDGRTVIAEWIQRSGGESDLSVIGPAGLRRVTIDAGEEYGPLWSADGKRFVYAKDGRILMKDTDGGEPSVVLAQGGGMPTSWSSDGRWLVFTKNSTKTATDVCVLDMAHSPSVTCPAATAASETDGQVSPDGKWIAYRFNDPSNPQIIVQSLDPQQPRRMQVSAPDKAALGPRWGRGGTELYFIEETALVSVAVSDTGGQIRFGSPQRLFDAPFYFSAYGYSPAPDGSRFLFSVSAEGTEEPRPGPIQVVMNRFGNWRSSQ